jgi:hypothetical protein
MDLTDVYRIFHPKATLHTFFSAAHSTFSKIGNILACETSLNKYMRTEVAVVFYPTTMG